MSHHPQDCLESRRIADRIEVGIVFDPFAMPESSVNCALKARQCVVRLAEHAVGARDIVQDHRVVGIQLKRASRELQRRFRFMELRMRIGRENTRADVIGIQLQAIVDESYHPSVDRPSLVVESQ